METGSAFEGMGSAREVSYAVLAEVAMFAAMLEYITVIPERLHHPKENLL